MSKAKDLLEALTYVDCDGRRRAGIIGDETVDDMAAVKAVASPSRDQSVGEAIETLELFVLEHMLLEAPGDPLSYSWKESDLASERVPASLVYGIVWNLLRRGFVTPFETRWVLTKAGRAYVTQHLGH